MKPFPEFPDLNNEDEDIQNFWVISYVEVLKQNIEENFPKKEDIVLPGFFNGWRLRSPTFDHLKKFLTPPNSIHFEWDYEEAKKAHQKIHTAKDVKLLKACTHSIWLRDEYPQIQNKINPSKLLSLWSFFARAFNPCLEDWRNINEKYKKIVEGRKENAEENLKRGRTQFLDGSTHPKNLQPTQIQRTQTLFTKFELSTYLDRVDEKGDSVCIGNVKASYASNIGPHLGQKSENQDATFVKKFRAGIVFALADGVGTSMGARKAAAVTVQDFCENLTGQLDQVSRFEEKYLIASVKYVHQRLNYLLEKFKANAADSMYADIRGSIQPDVAVRLCENTLNPTRRHWGPVFSTTLIGGVLWRHHEKMEMHILRIGDGIAEHYKKSTIDPIISYFDMDAEEMVITSSLCPGPLGKSSIEKAEFLPPIEISPGDSLLISSDGLKRGHNQSVWEKLSEIHPKFNNLYAVDILRHMSNYADSNYNEKKGTEKLFNDNLSLILINIEDTK
ncbi:MAG: protein phosphatase 2C domain-containing protein [Candidatus Omnitrophota bacterium]